MADANASQFEIVANPAEQFEEVAPPSKLQRILAKPGPSTPTAKVMGREAIEPRALLGGAAFGLGGESAGQEVGEHVEKELAGAEPGPIRREAARLGGAAVSGALTPLPGVGTAARAGYNVLGTLGADITGTVTDNPIAKFLGGTGLALMGDHMLDRAYATEPYEHEQGAPPKVGPEATVEAQEGAETAPEKAVEPAGTPEQPLEAQTPAAGPESPPLAAPVSASPISEAEVGPTQEAPAEAKPEDFGPPVKQATPAQPTPAEADLMTAQEINPTGAVTYMKVGDIRKNPDLMKVDPERFQFKQDVDKRGVGKDLGDVKKWSTGASGVLTAYHTDEGDYVLNGHHRFAAAMDLAPDDEVLRFQWLNGTDKELPGAIPYHDVATGEMKTTGVTPLEARAYGAVLNMQEQRGTAFDMAKFMRDTGLGSEALGRLGVSMTEAKTADAAGLSHLSPFLWDEVRRGNLKQPLGVVIGRELSDQPEIQNDLYKTIAGGKYTPAEVADLIRLSKGSEVVGEQSSLFGKDFLKNTTLPQQVKILANVRDDLNQNARLMSTAAKGKGALETAGETRIDESEVAARASMARRLGDLLPRFAYQVGSETNGTLKRLAYDLAAEPRRKTAIFERARTEIAAAVAQDATRSGLDLRPQAEPAETPQQGLFGGASQGAGATQLGSGFNPAAGVKAVQQLARAAAQKAGDSKALDALKAIFAPETRGAFAERAAAIQEEQSAELRARIGSAKVALTPLKDFFAKVEKSQRWNVYSELEQGNYDALPKELQPIAKVARDAFEKSWQEVAKIKDGEVGYIENYLPHLYADAPEKVADTMRELKSATGRSLTGSHGFLKQRGLTLMSDAIKSGLTPRYDNPADMMLAGLQNQWRYITGQRIMQSLKDAGLAQFYRYGEEPKGWTPIDDRIAKVRQYAPEYSGYIERGHFLAPESAARVINNFLAPGLRGGTLFDPLSSISAIGNALRVELSAFHMMLTANSAADLEAGGALTEGFGKLAHGDVKGGLISLSRVPKTWLTPVEGYKTWRQGQELMAKGLGGHLEDPAVRDVLLGGGSFDFGDSILTQGLVDAFGEKLGVAGETAKKLLGLTMRKVVAPMKLGAFQRLFGQELQDAIARNGGEDLTFVQRRQIAQGVRRHLDNVMGQIARDNIHTTNILKDRMGLIVSYPGWNIGTVRLFGGLARGLHEVGTGQALDQQARLALQYAAGKALRAGVTGLVIGKLMTGEWPKSIYDMYTWPTGQKDSNGNWIRVSPPEYLLRDALSFAGHERKQDPNDIMRIPKAVLEFAAGKANWPLVAGYELIKNADFFGRPIYFPHAEGTPKQAARILEYIAGQAGVPFSVRNIAEQSEQADQGGLLSELKNNPLALAKQAAVGVAGLTPAPRSLRQTPMENYVDQVEQNQIRSTITDPRQIDRMTAERQFESQARRFRAGEIKDLKPAAIDFMKRGFTDKDVGRLWKSSGMTPVESALRRIPLMEVEKAWKVAQSHGDQKDLDLARKVMADRIKNGGGWSRLPEDQRKALLPLLGEMFRPKPEPALGAGT